MAPSTMSASDTVVTIDLLAAPRALAGRVALDPMMKHSLGRPRRLDVGRDTRGRSPLDTSLVHCILAHYSECR